MLTSLVILIALLFIVNGAGLWAAIYGHLKLSDRLGTVWTTLLLLVIANVAALAISVVNSK